MGHSSFRGHLGPRQAPNTVNYDETKANPYPDLPDPLVLKGGRSAGGCPGQHKGGHTAGPNWPTFLKFAERYLAPAAKAPPRP